MIKPQRFWIREYEAGRKRVHVVSGTSFGDADVPHQAGAGAGQGDRRSRGQLLALQLRNMFVEAVIHNRLIAGMDRR